MSVGTTSIVGDLLLFNPKKDVYSMLIFTVRVKPSGILEFEFKPLGSLPRDPFNTRFGNATYYL